MRKMTQDEVVKLLGWRSAAWIAYKCLGKLTPSELEVCRAHLTGEEPRQGNAIARCGELLYQIRKHLITGKDRKTPTSAEALNAFASYVTGLAPDFVRRSIVHLTAAPSNLAGNIETTPPQRNRSAPSRRQWTGL